MLAQQVRIKRNERGWSQQELAAHLSVEYGFRWHQTTVAKVENGLRPIGLNEAVVLAMVFDITGAQLMEPVKRRREDLHRITARRQQLEGQLTRLSADLEINLREAEAEAASRAADSAAMTREVAETAVEDALAKAEAARQLMAVSRDRLAYADAEFHHLKGAALAVESRIRAIRLERERLEVDLADLRRLGDAVLEDATRHGEP
ncbi:Helix-turn-helix domain-containing protein [Asanoa hainanensis]|uniref:Helix-turn-helix domain-containing protein n=2 Tax=Asanoa hainanensis TaxID=560556 RepID=A0A239MDW2_9ACTN|nr:Helix-turn-helix domain-containing protein [Asanoa hainanensis]